MYLQEDVCWLEVLLLVRTMVEVRIAVAVAVARLAAWRATVREPEARLPVVAGFSAVRAAAIVPCVSSKHVLAVVSPATQHPPSARPRQDRWLKSQQLPQERHFFLRIRENRRQCRRMLC